MNLPESVTKMIDDAAGLELFADVLQKARADGRSEVVSYAMAWAAMSFEGYVETDGIYKRAAARALAIHDKETSKIPFPHEQDALGQLREDQTPRMLGAITHPHLLPTKTMSFDDLTAIQNRVSTEKVHAIAGQKKADKPSGVVARMNGKHYILDGHHRIAGDWLRGEKSVDVSFIDLDPVSNAMKSKEGAESESFTFSHEIRKINEEQRLVYGWASVIEEKGTPVVDYQGDVISSSDLVKAAHNFITSSRAAKALHQGDKVGEFVESVVFTPEVQKALGIDLGCVGWWVVMKVSNDKAWAAVKDGRLKMLSIGGRGKRIDNGQ